MTKEETAENKGSLICQSCRSELTKDNYCYCHLCMGSSTAHLMNRFSETSNLDQVHNWLQKLDNKMEAIEEILREIRIRLIPIKSKQSDWTKGIEL